MLKELSKTKKTKDTLHWRGGGGFQIAHLSLECFDYDLKLNRVMLTSEATGETLTKSVAANLGFTLLNDSDSLVFDARRGNTLLKVIEGVITNEIVDWLVAQTSSSETLLIAATSVPDGIREHLRKVRRGSRIVAIPDDIFQLQKGGEE